MRLGAIVVVTGLVGLVLVGCYGPNPGFMTATGHPVTYYSTELKPTTITIVDERSQEVIFSVEIPVGRQLTVDFQNGKGDDPVNTPDLMRYEVYEMGTKYGKLRNALTVPNQYCRSIRVDYRPAPESAPPPGDTPIRSDEGRPAWWTPDGGPVPRRRPSNMDQ